MGRFYAIAFVLVAGAGSAVFAHHALSVRALSVQATPRPGMTPTVTRGNGTSGAARAPFAGEGSWVMSALPACFDQVKSVIGRSDRIHDLPPPAQRLPAQTTLRWGDCRLHVGRDDVLIVRGADVVRVPPHASLFRGVDGRLVLVWSKDGRTEVRTYAPR